MFVILEICSVNVSVVYGVLVVDVVYVFVVLIVMVNLYIMI